MARIYADNIVFLMRPGEASSRRAARLPVPARASTGATVLSYRPAPKPAAAGTPVVVARPKARGLAWLVAAACVLPAALGFGWSLAHQLTQQQIAAASAPRQLALPGGGTARLEPGTALAVGTSGTLVLERGRVELAAIQPLRMQAGEGVIAATDARLRVAQADHTVRVTVLSGTAAVTLPASAQRVNLQAGQQLDYGYGRLGRVQPATR